jgi:hypothetical protein
MTYKLKLAHNHHDQLDQITAWLNENVGPGSQRHANNTWLGAEDWYCFEEALVDSTEQDQDDYYDNEDDLEDISDLIFVFRRESDLLMFSLKWA